LPGAELPGAELSEQNCLEPEFAEFTGLAELFLEQNFKLMETAACFKANAVMLII